MYGRRGILGYVRKEYTMNNELYFDGSCAPVNPGGEGKYGYVINRGIETFTGNGSLGRYTWMTNNIAEWEALIRGIEHCIYLGIEDLVVYGDSKLAVNCGSGRWKTKAEHLKKYKIKIDKLKQSFKSIRFEWIPREENYLADELSNI